jgi:uncharacterized SAM-binding protein YcdF (DUF218 family)
VSERVVAVLGYSGRRNNELHRICAERLAHAQQVADGARAVILSGLPEAELMRAAWTGPDVLLVCDPEARSTAANARNVAGAARALHAQELVVVTSGWHRARARILMRAALRNSGMLVAVEAANGSRPVRLLARELACLALVPFQLFWGRIRGWQRDAESRAASGLRAGRD